jgi:hypothetical protein
MSTTATAAAATTTITTETNENSSYRCGNGGGREGAEQHSKRKDIQRHVDVMRMRMYRRERKLMAYIIAFFILSNGCINPIKKTLSEQDVNMYHQCHDVMPSQGTSKILRLNFSSAGLRPAGQ